MGLPEHPHKVKLIVGLLSTDETMLDRTVAALSRSFGPVDFKSPILKFTHSSYYREEMGENLKRLFISFQKLVNLKNIAKIKVTTNALEKRSSKNGKRTVNIDPGYLDNAKLVLFSTKDYTHRIYLDHGIYAEVTLFYKDRKYNAWPWTYPDYKTVEYLGFFNEIRDLYKKAVTE